MQEQQNFPSFTSHLFLVCLNNNWIDRERWERRVYLQTCFQSVCQGVPASLKMSDYSWNGEDNEVKLNERDGRKRMKRQYPSCLLFLRINVVCSWWTPRTVCCVRGWRVSDVNLSYRRDDNDYYVGVLRLRYRVIEFYWRPIGENEKCTIYDASR